MSEFDKCVFEWLYSASIDRQSKHQILENVITAIDEYKKMEGKGLTTQRVNNRTSKFGTQRASRNGRTREERRKWSLIDFQFSGEVNEGIYQLDHEGTIPLPSTLSQQGENGSEYGNVRLNVAKHARHPQNGHSMPPVGDLQERHEIYDELESEGVLSIKSDRFGDNRNCNEDDMKAMYHGFETFRFGRASSQAISTSSSDMDDCGNAAFAGKDEIIDDFEDERRRLMTMKGPSRPGISALTIGTDEMMSTEFPTTPKSPETLSLIVSVLEKHFLFSYLDDKELRKLAMVMNTEEVPGGCEVVSKGEASSKLYIILDGRGTMTMFEGDVNRTVTESLQKGSVFGELGLLYESQNDVSVRSITPLVCATLERNTYKIVVSRAAEEKRQRYVSFLENVPFLKGLTPQERLKLAEALKDDNYTKGDKIIKYGEKVDWLHIIVEGTVDVIGRNEAGKEEYVASHRAGECVGDLEFLYHHETVADVVVTSPCVRTAKMGRLHFEQLIGTAKELLDCKAKEDALYKYYRRTMIGASPPREDPTPPFDAPPEYLSKLNVPLKL